MIDLLKPSRREFLGLSAAAGATWALGSGIAQAAVGSVVKPTAEWAIKCTAMHTPSPSHLEVLQEALIVVGTDGVITRVESNAESAGHFRETGRLIEFGPSHYLLPGLIDTHVHAPQWPQMGTALDLPLEKWLIEYTFKTEARYADPEFARRMYTDLVATLLANGTTTAVYYGSLHLPATQILAELCLKQGQRALVGRTAMDDPTQCPDTYRDKSAAVAIDETRRFIDFVKAMSGNERRLVEPVITPRFIPSCTDELLKGLGKIAVETGLPIQTHCSESDWEHNFALKRFGVTDTVALIKFGLMNRRTILGHGPHTTHEDRDLIREHGAAIAHCPLSNAFGSDGILPVRSCMEQGLHIALGTDIAGGPTPSMFDPIKMATTFSQLLQDGVDPARSREGRGTPNSRIDFVTSFYLATAGGGVALDLPIGVFKPGYRFDAMLVDATVPDTNLREYAGDPPEDRLQRIIWDTTRPNIAKVWVDGALVRG
jgi:guanine deaminase